MNCRIGDLAMVVRNTKEIGCQSNFIGTPLKVTQAFESLVGTAWLYSGPMLRCPHCRGVVFAFLDADLQPLRPPPLGTTTETPADVIRDLAPKRQVEHTL